MAGSERRVALRAVAERAGVSLGTASNVFSEKAGVSEEARRAVLAAAAELGYRPRPRLTTPPPGVSMLGLVIRNEVRSITLNPFYAHVLEGALAACAVRGVGLMYEMLHAQLDTEQMLPIMIQRKQVQGILITGYVNPTSLSLLQQTGLPFVLVDSYVDPPIADSVCGDDERGGYLATRYLLDHGHCNPVPAIIAGPLEHPSMRDRLAGYRRALAERGLALDETYVRLGSLGQTRGREEMHALLDLSVRPTAVFCCNDATAQGALTALHERHVAVPDECSVVGYDDIVWASHAVPPLTTIRVDKELLGAQAVRHLLERIEFPDMALRHTRIGVTLIERQSVRAR